MSTQWIKRLQVAAFALLGVSLIGGIVLVSVYDFVVVNGSSMKNTLKDGDLLVLKPCGYTDVSVGDIVVFNIDGKERHLIKRVIAVGGDKVEVKPNGVYVNGVLSSDRNALDSGYVYAETNEIEISENCLYVLGDNRAVSLDSRNPAVGQVESSQLRGKVVLNLSAGLGGSAEEIRKSCITTLLSLLGLTCIMKFLLWVDKLLERKKKKSLHRSE